MQINGLKLPKIVLHFLPLPSYQSGKWNDAVPKDTGTTLTDYLD